MDGRSDTWFGDRVFGWKEVCWRPIAAEDVRIARERYIRDHDVAKKNPRQKSKVKRQETLATNRRC